MNGLGPLRVPDDSSPAAFGGAVIARSSPPCMSAGWKHFDLFFRWGWRAIWSKSRFDEEFRLDATFPPASRGEYCAAATEFRSPNDPRRRSSCNVLVRCISNCALRRLQSIPLLQTAPRQVFPLNSRSARSSSVSRQSAVFSMHGTSRQPRRARRMIKRRSPAGDAMESSTLAGRSAPAIGSSTPLFADSTP